MSQVVNQYDFTVIDYTTTQYGYLFTVGTTGSRPEDYRFIYMPYSRYPSVLMLDFYMARSISHGFNHQLVEAIRKDLEGEERFIVLGDAKQGKEGILPRSSEGTGSTTKQGNIMDFSFEMERSALIEALEMDHRQEGHRLNDEKVSAVDEDMTEGWRVDNDKELKIVRNLGLTRNFVKNLDKLEPGKISFRVSDFGMIADYADSAEEDSQSELVIKQLVHSVRNDKPDMDVAEVFEEVKKNIGRSTENNFLLEALQDNLRTTVLGESIQSQKVSRQNVELLYQDLLGQRESGKETFTEEATIIGARIYNDQQLSIFSEMSTAFIRRFQEIKYMHIDRTSPQGTRVYNTSQLALMRTLGGAIRETTFSGMTTGKIAQAFRDIEESIFLSQLNQATRDIEYEMMTHENVLAKLKDRQYPTFLHTDIRGVRQVDKRLHLQDDLGQSTRDRYRYEPVLRPSDILWHPMQAQRIINKHPSTIESDIIFAKRDIESITDVERQFPWAVRSHAEDMNIINDLTTAQRVYLESMYIEYERPEARRIYVVQSTVDRDADQAYRESTEYGFVFRDLQESRRISKIPGYVERESTIGKRVFVEALELLSNLSLGERQSKLETYIEERFHTAKLEQRKLFIPNIEESADRKKSFNGYTTELTTAERALAHDLWLPEFEEHLAEKKVIRPSLFENLKTFGKNDNQKQLHLTDKPLESHRDRKKMDMEAILQSIRDMGRPTMIRDELLDKLVGGGWLGNKAYPGYLDEEFIVGEILQNSPAVILEMMMEAVNDDRASSYFDENFLIGVRERVDALIDCGILTADKEGARSGIISFNFEGSKKSQIGVIGKELAEASKNLSETILEDESLSAEMNRRRSTLEADDFEGVKVKENLHGEITEVIYGADFNARPAIIEAEDPLGYLIPGGGLYPDDPAYQGSKVERRGQASAEYTAGAKFERDGATLDHGVMGSSGNRESVLHTEFNMGGASRDRYGIINEEYTLGGTNLRQMLLNTENLIGTPVLREGYSKEHEAMGTIPTREALFTEEYSIGTAKIRQLYFNESYSIGWIELRQAAIDIDYSLATLIWRPSFLSKDYSISSAKSRDGEAEIRNTFGSLWARESAMDIEFNAGMRQTWESTLESVAPVGNRGDLYGMLQNEVSLAFTEVKTADLDDILLADSIKREGQLSVDIISDNINRLSFMLEENHSTRIMKHASVHEVESEVVKLRFSQLDDEAVYGGKGIRDADFIELIYEAIKGKKDSTLEDTLVIGSKGTRIALMEESLLSIHLYRDTINFDNDVVFACKNTQDAYLHETTESVIEKIANLEEQLVADKPKYGYLDPVLPLGGTNLKYGDVPVESVGGTGLSYGDMPIEIVGGTNLKYGDVPVEIVGGTNLKYGAIENVLSADKPQYGNMEEDLLADKPQYGHLEENIFGLKNVKDSFLHSQLLGLKYGKEADLIQTIDLNKDSRSAFQHDNLFGRKGERWAHTHETVDDVMKLRNGSLDQDMLYGNKELRESILEMELVGFQYKQLDLIQSEDAYLKTRDVHIEDDSFISSRSSYDAYNHQLDSGMNLLRSTTLDWEQLAAGKIDRYGHSHEMESGVAGERDGDHFDGIYGTTLQRFAFSGEELSYGNSLPYTSCIVNDGETFGSKLIDPGYLSKNDFEGITEERETSIERELPTGIANARLSEIEDPDRLMASFEERCSQVITGFIFAERPEKRAEYLEQLHAFLPERTAHLMEIYHEAKMEPRDSFTLTDHPVGHRESTDAYIPMMDTMAQGLIFDYSDDLLDRGMDPEDWEGGLGVPEDYDPNDPFNVYYPYSKDMDALELSQSDDWNKFGKGDWDRDRLIGKFYSKEDTKDISGWYRNNFLAETYKFSVDFKVDTDTDGDGAGIIFKYFDENNYWMFMVHGGDSDNSLDMRTPMQLYKIVAGNPTAVGSPMQPFKWEKNKWYTLSVSVMENKLQIYTDSKLQYDLTGTD
ncbi:MAG TPA: hypothetical protein DEF35_29850 [Paenibacillus sp.]|uniref:hypothetical protein n=1 Tax=Paenibacillus TaxID=44249 RepID=UPI000BA0A765|nr:MULTISPECIES: hypothetical protein [Paenibacillus]OZQ72411.1 hypothetical protein CA599_06355 [Paenibacillus taichungensis]HBU85821.1 hypothetical protein [Paenibacillus sp.]